MNRIMQEVAKKMEKIDLMAEKQKQIEEKLNNVEAKIDGNCRHTERVSKQDKSDGLEKQDLDNKAEKTYIEDKQNNIPMDNQFNTDNIERGNTHNRTKGRIILEGGSRMKNVQRNITKIHDKMVYVTAKSGSTLNGVSYRLRKNLSEGDKDSVVVIQSGANDLYKGDSVRTVCDNVIKILAFLKGKVKAVIVTSMIPTENTGRIHNPQFCSKVKRLNFELLSTVKSNGGYYLDLIDSFQNGNGTLKEHLYKEDLLHLNEQGNILFCNILRNWVEIF